MKKRPTAMPRGSMCVEDFKHSVSIVDMLVERAKRLYLPIDVVFELTYACNLHCIHYYADGQDNQKLSLPEIGNILAQLKDAGTWFLTLTGGETLLHNDFRRIVQVAKEQNFWLRVFTNGTLIDRKMAEFLASSKPIIVEISLYGTNAETHECVTRVPGSFRKTMNALDLLQELGVRVVVKSPIMRCNLYEYPKLVRFAESRGFEYRFTHKISPTPGGCLTPIEQRLLDDELAVFYNMIMDLTGELPCCAKPITHMSNEHLCTAGINACRIAPNGDVFPCILMPIKAGNLRNHSFLALWQNSSIFKRLRNTTIASLPACNQCNLLPWCWRCSAEALLEDKDLFGKSMGACRTAAASCRFFESIRSKHNLSYFGK